MEGSRRCHGVCSKYGKVAGSKNHEQNLMNWIKEDCMSAETHTLLLAYACFRSAYQSGNSKKKTTRPR